MPAGMGEEERFAAAVENGTTPASAGWGDDSADGFARELEIAAMLRSGGPALAPDPATRDRAKRRLMAAFAQEFGHDVDAAMEFAGGDATVPTAPLQVLAPVALATRVEPAHRAEPTAASGPVLLRPTRAGRHSAPEPEGVEPEVAEPEVAEPEAPDTDNVRPLRRREAGQRGHRRGAAFFGAAAAAALVALAGTGTFASQDALPGDPMYGIKRVAESTSYALTFGEKAKARRHLEQAQRRLDEVEGLVARSRTGAAASPAKASDPQLVQSTMQEFDTDTSEGSRLLLSGPKPDTGQVDEVRTWATQQSQRLSEIRSAMPAPDRADASLALLDQVLGETAALQNGACAPEASGSAAGGVGTGAAGAGACAPVGATTARGATTHTRSTAAPDDTRTSAGTSATARPDDDATADTGTSADADPGTTPVRTTTKGASRSGGSEEQQSRRDDGSDSGSDGSGSSGGSDDVSVPLPVSGINLPSPGSGLPGVHLGR